MIDFCVVKVFMVLFETNNALVIKFLKFTQRPWSKTSEKQKDSGMLRFVSMGRNNAFKVVTQSYFNTDHMIDYCVVKVFMVLLKTKTA